MEILVIAATLLLCFLVDRVFTKLFRSAPEHQTGKAVRLNKMYGVGGLILAVLGVAALISGVLDTTVLTVAGVVVILTGVCLLVYYMTFGIFYGDDTFLLTTFGTKSAAYHYRDIRGQKLYLIQGGSVVIELHLSDGRSVQLQSNMDGVYPFLDHAFGAWLRQTGRIQQDCPFYDPSQSCWFPSVDGEG